MSSNKHTNRHYMLCYSWWKMNVEKRNAIGRPQKYKGNPANSRDGNSRCYLKRCIKKWTSYFSCMYGSVLLYEPTSNKIVHCLEPFAGLERFTFKRDARTCAMHARKRKEWVRVELGGLSLEVWCRYLVRFLIEIHLNIIVDIREFVRTRWIRGMRAYARTMQQRFRVSALSLPEWNVSYK